MWRVYISGNALLPDKPSASEKCSALQQQLGQYQAEVDRRVRDTEERERRSLSRALLEERSWFCGFINAFSRVAVSTGHTD